jgi:hypothetical protein
MKATFFVLAVAVSCVFAQPPGSVDPNMDKALASIVKEIDPVYNNIKDSAANTINFGDDEKLYKLTNRNTTVDDSKAKLNHFEAYLKMFRFSHDTFSDAAADKLRAFIKKCDGSVFNVPSSSLVPPSDLHHAFESTYTDVWGVCNKKQNRAYFYILRTVIDGIFEPIRIERVIKRCTGFFNQVCKNYVEYEYIPRRISPELITKTQARVIFEHAEASLDKVHKAEN